ncbi:Hypothetical protein CAP_7575 [Chondromyces apiculatus DSM 436]|uniref:PDZ domain-containing protein n=1 Tax=Chondromyces apiculatus DSM 436 TaxID=1192034 RepID=A0A017SYV9_9BACT|nr:Hypothetical protein CAP_7575 [Chondromyces apiculatus DSM 436]
MHVLFLVAQVVLGVMGGVYLFFRWRSPEAGLPSPAPSSNPNGSSPRFRATQARLLTPGSISGRITGPAGAPIAQATVCASPEAEMMMPSDAAPTCTSAAPDGTYRISPLHAARWTVFASARGYRPRGYVSPGPERERALSLGAGEARTGVDLTLIEGGVEVRGQIKDVGGGGIAEALVSFSTTFGALQGVAAARTDAEGAFVAWVDEGHYVARASAEEYADGWSVGEAPGPPIEIMLTPGSTLTGRVVEAGTDTPVAGARVEAGGDPMSGMVSGVTTSTDEEGRFRLQKLTPGRYKPSARASGGFGQVHSSILLGVGQSVGKVVIEVHAARNVAGRVVIEPSKAPCTGGLVALQSQTRIEGRQEPIGADGWARFEGLLPDTYRTVVICKQHGVTQDYPLLVLGEEDREDLEWPVRAGLTVQGKVVDRENRPMRAMVHANAAGLRTSAVPIGFGRSDEDGHFEIHGLSAGKHHVFAQVEGYPPSAEVEVEVEERTPEVTLTIDTGGSRIEGTLVDTQQRPVVGADISVMGGKVYEGRMTRSGTDGSFVLKAVKPGEYRITAAKEGIPLKAPGQQDEPPRAASQAAGPFGGAMMVPLGLPPPQGVPVTVKEGAVARVKLVVELQEGEIHGRVVDEGGAPVTDAFIHTMLDQEGGPSLPGASSPRARMGNWSPNPVLTDPDGAFTVGNLGQGKYTLRAYRKGGGDAFAEHVSAGQTVTLTIRKTGSIAGTFLERGARGAPPPAQFTLGVREGGMPTRQESFFQTGGAWTIDDLPEGTYQLDAVAPEGTASATVTIASGEQRTGVELVLTPRATIKGQIVSLDDGTPVAGARVSVMPSGYGSPLQVPGPPTTTDAAGRFELTQVTAGKVALMATFMMAPTPALSAYDPVMMPFEAQPGAALDLGVIPMAKRRLTLPSPPGDLGFMLAPPENPQAAMLAPILKVGTVRPDGPAAKGGLQVGDTIVSVDGHDVTGRWGYLYHSLTAVHAGTTVTLGLARGARVPIVAAELSGGLQMPPGLPPQPSPPSQAPSQPPP